MKPKQDSLSSVFFFKRRENYRKFSLSTLTPRYVELDEERMPLIWKKKLDNNFKREPCPRIEAS